MTTIVCDRRSMAADSRITSSSKERAVKVFKVGEAIIGYAGMQTQGMKFIHWYKTREGDTPTLADTEVIVLTKKGIEYWDDAMFPIPIKEKFTSIGSGTLAALGAMHAGCSPEEAAKIACKLDPYSAPPVKVLWLEEEEKE